MEGAAAWKMWRKSLVFIWHLGVLEKKVFAYTVIDACRSCLPCMTSYAFICKNCHPSGIECYMKKPASKLRYFPVARSLHKCCDSDPACSCRELVDVVVILLLYWQHLHRCATRLLLICLYFTLARGSSPKTRLVFVSLPPSRVSLHL